jgi:hypothetical protein
MPRASRVIGLIAAAVLPVVALVAVAGPAQAGAVQVCVPVHATGAGQDQGQDTQGNLHTTATLSVLGIAVGTTNATFVPAPPPVGTVLSFAGPIVFTPRFGPGTLTANTQGSVDLATGVFSATSTSVSGTGPFRPVSGQLTFAGTENLTTGAFTETVTGRLCAGGRAPLTPLG